MAKVTCSRCDKTFRAGGAGLAFHLTWAHKAAAPAAPAPVVDDAPFTLATIAHAPAYLQRAIALDVLDARASTMTQAEYSALRHELVAAQNADGIYPTTTPATTFADSPAPTALSVATADALIAGLEAPVVDATPVVARKPRARKAPARTLDVDAFTAAAAAPAPVAKLPTTPIKVTLETARDARGAKPLGQRAVTAASLRVKHASFAGWRMIVDELADAPRPAARGTVAGDGKHHSPSATPNPKNVWRPLTGDGIKLATPADADPNASPVATTVAA